LKINSGAASQAAVEISKATLFVQSRTRGRRGDIAWRLV
jgi:hypothetical protein